MPGGDSKSRFRIACFAVIERDGRYLLARRSDIGWWNLPGGGMEFGETVVACLEREVREEVGLHLTAIRPAGVYTKTRKPEVVFTFLAAPAPDSPPPGISEEVSEVGWFSIDALPDRFLPKHRRRLLEAAAHSRSIIFGTETTSTEEDQRLSRR